MIERAKLPFPATVRDVLRSWRIGHWVAAALVAAFPVVMGNSGGFILAAASLSLSAEIDVARVFILTMATIGLPLIFAVRVADRYVDAGVARVVAYGAAVLAVAIGGTVVGWLWVPRWIPVWGWMNQPGALLHVALMHGVQMGLGVAAYSSWRHERKSRDRIRLIESEHARAAQEALASRLLALQARVEPAVLFDALRRIAAALPAQPQAAEELLTDLIAMLRAMLPRIGDDASTVQREVELVRLLARVTGNANLQPPRLEFTNSPETALASIAPMVLSPLVQSVTAAVPGQMRVDVVRAEERLRMTVRSTDTTAFASGSEPAGLASIRERLSGIYGAAARLFVDTQMGSALVLEIPYRNGHGADR